MNSHLLSCKLKLNPLTYIINYSTSLNSELTVDALNFDKFDTNIYALRNYINLNEKEIITNYNQFEQIFKSQKYNMNCIINSFYFSNFPILLLDVFEKLQMDEYRSFKDFLK